MQKNFAKKAQEFKIMFAQYLKTKERTDLLIRSMSHSLLQNPSLSKIIKQQAKKVELPFHFLKYLMLLNRIIFEKALNLNQVEGILDSLHVKENDQMEKMFNKKLLNPYLLYLRKRSKKDIVQLKDPTKSFALLNLIICGTSFADSILTFGRYFGKINLFFIDFNIILAHDIRNLYQKMTKSIQSVENQWLYDQLERVHEKMYLVFYNCYFYKYTTKLAPKWISTENSHPQINVVNSMVLSNQSKKWQKQRQRQVSWQVLEAKSLNRVQYQNSMLVSRLQALRSMEKIVQTMQDV